MRKILVPGLSLLLLTACGLQPGTIQAGTSNTASLQASRALELRQVNQQLLALRDRIVYDAYTYQLLDNYIKTASLEEKRQALKERYIGLKASSDSLVELKCHFEFGIKICIELPDPPASPSHPVKDPTTPEKPNKPSPVKPTKPKK